MKISSTKDILNIKRGDILLLNDLKMVYSKAFRETTIRLKNNPIMAIVPGAYSVLYYLANRLVAGFASGISGLAYGFIVPIVGVLILSSYYEILSDLNAFGKISFRNFKSSFTRNFMAIYSVLFIMFIISNIMRLETTILFLLTVIIFIVFNPIAETIYIRGENYIDAYSYSANFMKENSVHWILPLIAYLGVVLVLTNISVVFSLISNVVNIPMGIGYMSVNNVAFIIVELITSFYAVFRGALFNILSKSTMRKRAYMGGLD